MTKRFFQYETQPHALENTTIAADEITKNKQVKTDRFFLYQECHHD